MLDQGSSQQQLAEVYQRESRRVLATLIRLLGSFDLAEEALHDAFMVAATQWPSEGVPDNPRAWLVSTGRFKAIDQLRRRARFDESQQAIADSLYQQTERDLLTDDDRIEDDRLRLIFTCCHPSLSPDAQIALTLREVCDLSTEEIVGLYDLLLQVSPSPVVALNRAAAVAMRDGWAAGLALMDQLHDQGALAGYHLLPAARAHLLAKLGRDREAWEAYGEALALVQQEPERRYLQGRLKALQ
ncbi:MULTISPECIES: RNA polymerase sigma factor [unclassified Marinimicrobium]|jgi:RNA polymerase sigma factor (sigma-70 family)|uniref:RNA polymerase sigma factor n=1 Tax=unclassified Marinimicrobium TaxID=2632100 RepID=UPI000C56E283|nr:MULTISPECIES: sigma factor [unclassified Marinimicrobium]MAN51307.1 hypothetical protein [Marinimicrobium sp.]